MAETIKDFLVSIGFSVDSSSENKFKNAIRSATLQADLLARGLEGAAVAIAKAVAQISAGFESVYYTAQRANTSVSSLRAMTYALSQLGTSAGSAESSLSNFGRRLATDPGAESMLKAIGVRTRDASGKLRDTTKLFEEFGKVTAKMPTYVALGYAQQLGVDEDTMRAMREQPDLLARLRREQEEYARSIGMNQDEAARKGQKFMQSLRRLQMVVTLVSEKILSDLAPALKAFVDQVIEWIRQNPDAIRDGLVQIGDAAQEFAKACIAIAKELAPVITKIGEMAGSITGHGGLQGTMELFAAFMVGSWALRIVTAITGVSTAWGALMLRLGIPLLIGAVATGHSFQTPEQAAKDPEQAKLQREGIERRGAVRDWIGDKWERTKRIFGGGSAEAHGGDGGGEGIRRRGQRALIGDQSGGVAANPGDYKDVLDHIARSEGTANRAGGGYNTSLGYGRYLPGGQEQNLTGKTLNEILELGRYMRRQPGNPNSSAMGRYQVVGDTLRAQMRVLGLKGTDLFTPELQDRIGANLAKARGANATGLRQEWASLVGARNQIAVELMRKVPHGASIIPHPASEKPDLAGAAKGLGKLMSEGDKAEAAKIEAAKAEANKARGALTEAQRDEQDREKRERWQAVYRATGDATKADEAARTLAPRKDVPEAPEARRPTFSPAFGADKAPPLAGPTNNSRSASLTQNNTFNVQGGDPRQTADLVAQGQKTVGTFGLEGIKSAIR
jgi:muramidase (phage lysozyme)